MDVVKILPICWCVDMNDGMQLDENYCEPYIDIRIRGEFQVSATKMEVSV